jgi:hypothetical protein
MPPFAVSHNAESTDGDARSAHRRAINKDAMKNPSLLD